MRTYRGQKAALTKAVNSGDPRKVLAETGRFFREYDEAGKPLPDDWHRWDVAQWDAIFATRMEVR